ncbi:MAG TPA: 5-formyltetrahydrofolate cyclo-ligase [Pyrinomonadaceae bacterium]|jgi:5-formyltetrahydrofolate cyclo-ligase|nr:5-formyltetrahydrofolate cyclo-ligase [Pyrinomonadaceae bacterium]
MTKAELRQVYLEKRRGISAAELDAISRAVSDRFFRDVDLAAVKKLHTFIRAPSKHEIDTSRIYYRLWKDRADIETYAPRIASKTGEMESVFFHAASDLTENRWGIREPDGEQIAQPSDFDVVLVPLLAFDTKGHRVGYGKGYYDRLLAACRSACLKVGLCAFEAEAQIDDIHAGDVRLDLCLTPNETIRF